MAVNDPNVWKIVVDCDHGIYTCDSETGEGECRECGAELRWSDPRSEDLADRLRELERNVVVRHVAVRHG